MAIECTDPNGHRWHFIDFTPKYKRIYTDRERVTDVSVIENEIRYVRFVCENCGEINKVEVDKTQLD